MTLPEGRLRDVDASPIASRAEPWGLISVRSLGGGFPCRAQRHLRFDHAGEEAEDTGPAGLVIVTLVAAFPAQFLQFVAHVVHGFAKLMDPTGEFFDVAIQILFGLTPFPLFPFRSFDLVFPAPDLPTMPRNSPGCISMLISLRAKKSPDPVS